MSIQAMKMALEALVEYHDYGFDREHCFEVIKEIQAAIAEAEKCEPVAWVRWDEEENYFDVRRTAPSQSAIDYLAKWNRPPWVPAYPTPQPAIPAWQPIETAPKDGTYVLVSNGRGVWVARFKDVYTSGWKPECPWQSMMLNHDHIPTKSRKGHPTHWIPLPAAPKPENGHD